MQVGKLLGLTVNKFAAVSVPSDLSCLSLQGVLMTMNILRVKNPTKIGLALPPVFSVLGSAVVPGRASFYETDALDKCS